MTDKSRSVDELIQSFATSAGTVQQAYRSLEDELLKANFPQEDDSSDADNSHEEAPIWEFRKNLIHVMDMLEQPVLVLNENLDCITWNDAGRVVFSIKNKEEKITDRIFQPAALQKMKGFITSNSESEKINLPLKSPVIISAECEIRRHFDNFTKSVLLTVTCTDDQLLKSGTVRGKIQMQNLIGNLAHNIRTPISAIGGYAQLLQKDLGGNKKYFDKIQFINDGVQRIDRIIRNLIEYSHDPVLPEENPYSLTEFLKHEIDSFNTLNANSTFIGVECEWISDDVNCTLNQKAIRTILKNILQNSLESFKQEKDIIKVSNSLVNDTIQLRIEDNGTGMNDEILSKCREPFFTTRINGLGLGLSIVDNMSMILNGDMTIESQEKGGTVITLTFN